MEREFDVWGEVEVITGEPEPETANEHLFTIEDINNYISGCKVRFEGIKDTGSYGAVCELDFLIKLMQHKILVKHCGREVNDF